MESAVITLRFAALGNLFLVIAVVRSGDGIVLLILLSVAIVACSGVVSSVVGLILYVGNGVCLLGGVCVFRWPIAFGFLD